MSEVAETATVLFSVTRDGALVCPECAQRVRPERDKSCSVCGFPFARAEGHAAFCTVSGPRTNELRTWRAMAAAHLAGAHGRTDSVLVEVVD